MVPAADAHWAVGATPGSAVTHNHVILAGDTTTIAYMGPRICSDSTTSTNLVWSGEHGLCPAGTSPRVTPIRGFIGLGVFTFVCQDLTISSQTSVKVSEHAGAAYPNAIVVNDADANDAFYSASRTDDTVGPNGFRYEPNVAEPGASGNFGGTGNGASSSTSRNVPATGQASERQITTDGLSVGNAGTQGTYTRVPGNDMYDGSTVSPVDSSGTGGVPFSSPPASRSGSGNQNVIVDEGTDHDFETCLFGDDFTYAVDDGPNGNGLAAGTGAGCNAHYCFTDALTTLPDGCQNPTADFGCTVDSAGTSTWCGAGQDLNDPVRPPGDTSLLLVAETPVGQIGNDGVFDYVGLDGACAATQLGATNQPAAHTQSAMINSGTKVGLANANTQGMKLGALADPITALYTINQNGVQSPIRPVMYLVCNDVTGDGCTNTPIENSAGGTPGGPLEQNGHVAARLQLCAYDPLTQTVKTNPGGAINGLLDPVRYFGEAAEWGGQERESLGLTSRPCWPELLEFNPTIGLWSPASSSNHGGTVWEPDQAPATARTVEDITLNVQEGNFALLDGWVMDNNGAAPGDCTGLSITDTTCSPRDAEPIGLLGTGITPSLWIAGYAAVFV